MTPRLLNALVLLHACGLLLVASAARADRALLLPHAGEPRLLEQRERAQRAVAAALREAGPELRESPPAGPARKDACTQVACAPALLKQLGAELAVALAVWQGEGGSEVHVTIVDSSGSHFPGRALIAAGGDPAQSARSALLDAQSLRLLGPGPWVAVDGKPAGAAVWIDGRFAGSLPYRAGLAPGDHTLEVRAEGHAAKQLDLRVPLEPTATTRVDVALPAQSEAALAATAAAATAAEREQPTAVPADPTIDTSPPDEAPRTTQSPWNFVLGGALAAAGGLLIVVDPVRVAIREGRCVDPECKQEYRFGTKTALKLVAGITLIGSGLTVLIWQPLRVEARVGPDQAVMHARLSF